MASASARRIPILMYHEIADKSDTRSPLAVSPSVFAAQLGYLHDNGFTVLSAGSISAALTSNAAIPDRVVALTFDDGYEDFYRQAMPQLARYGFTCTIFMTSGWVKDAGGHRTGTHSMLTWRQLAETASVGFEVGGHTCQHPQLDQLPDHLLRQELLISKEVLEEKLGMPVAGLAYPFGYSNARVRQVARDTGYSYAYAVGNTMATPRSDLFAIPRLTVRRATTLDAFRRMIDGQDTTQLRRDRMLTRGWSVARRARATLRTVQNRA